LFQINARSFLVLGIGYVPTSPRRNSNIDPRNIFKRKKLVSWSVTICWGLYLARSSVTFFSLAVLLASTATHGYVVRGSPEDFGENFIEIPFSDLDVDPKLNSSTVIVDDAIRPDERECEQLYELLVRRRHHDDITVIVNAHSVERNNIHCLVQHFTHVVFTNAAGNASLARSFGRKHYLGDPAEFASVWQKFRLSYPTLGYYLRYTTASGVLDILDTVNGKIMAFENPLRREIQNYLEPFGDVAMRLSLLDYIL
jgi:hypothetical protein